MLLPLAEQEAASAFSERGAHVLADENGALLVFGEQAEDLVDRLFGGTGQGEVGLAHDQLEVDLADRALAACDPVADRSPLHRDDLLQPVAAVGGGGEAEEVAGGGVPNSSLEGEGG